MNDTGKALHAGDLDAIPKRWHAMAVLLLCELLALWLQPVLSLPDGYWMGRRTLSFDLLRSLGVLEAWKQGFWDARFLPTFDFGYGYAIFSFYGPLYSWVSAGWMKLLGNWQLGMVLGIGTFLVIGTAGVFAAARLLYRAAGATKRQAYVAGVIASAAWLICPYLKVNIFVRSDGSEFAGMCAMPWVMYGAMRILLSGTLAWRNLVPLALPLAMAVLSHNICAMFAMILVAVVPVGMVVLLLDQRDRLRGMFRALPGYAAATAWGLALAAFFWIPALVEMRYTRAFGIFHEHGMAYQKPADLLELGRFYAPVGQPMPLHLGWIAIPAIVSGVVTVILGRGAARRLALILLLGIALLCWMLMPGSDWFWHCVPMLRVVQFSFRVLTICTLLVCLVLPAILLAGRPVVRLIIVGGAAVAITCSLVQYRMVFPRPLPDVRTLWQGKVLTAVLNEYATIWQPQAASRTVRPGTVAAGENVDVLSTVGEYKRMKIRLRATATSHVAVAYTYIPGWYAYIEEGDIPLKTGPTENGMIRISAIPPGDHVVRLSFGDTPVRAICKVLSVAAAAGVLAALGWRWCFRPSCVP